jgi:hypothetical protein
VIGKAEWMTPSEAEADDATQRKKKKAEKARKSQAAAQATIALPGRANPRFVAAHRLGADTAGQRHLRHDPPEAVEDRRAGPLRADVPPCLASAERDNGLRLFFFSA